MWALAPGDDQTRTPRPTHYNNFVPAAASSEISTTSPPRHRFTLRLIIAVGYWFIRLIGPTLRVCVSREEGAQETVDQRPLIVSFWHACMIPATYVCRDIGVR